MTSFRFFMLIGLLFALPLAAAALTLPVNFHTSYISGTVTCGGAPLTGVRVGAVTNEGGHAEAVDASGGTYSIGVCKGEWMIMAQKDGYYMEKMLKVSVGDDETKEPVNIAMKKSTAFVEGTVVDESDKPIPRAHVTATPGAFPGAEGESEEAGPPQQGGFFQATCDAHGKFRLQAMKGSFMLMAMAPGYELSRKNPLPNMPGMENMPEQYRNMMPAMGPQVKLAEGETKTGVVIILRPAQSGPRHHEARRPEDTEQPPAVTPMPNILVGKAELSPNNVLHWTRKEKSKEFLMYVVTRYTKDPSGTDKGEIRTFKYTDLPYGMPGESYCSLTDSTAVPGETYWYTVSETGTAGTGPSSNVVMITTR